MEVRIESMFWEFHQKKVPGRPCAPCRSLGGGEKGQTEGARPRRNR